MSSEINCANLLNRCLGQECGWPVIQEQTVGEHKVLPLKRQCGYFFTSPPG
jgi:hypothetical protein